MLGHKCCCGGAKGDRMILQKRWYLYSPRQSGTSLQLCTIGALPCPMWAHHGRLYWKRSGIAISVGSTLVSSGSLIICENETEYDEPGVPFSCVDSDADSCSVLTDECEPRLHAWCMNSILLLLGIYLSETIWPNFGSTGVNVSRFTSELSSGAHVCAVPGPIVHGSVGWVQQNTEPHFYTFLMLFSK